MEIKVYKTFEITDNWWIQIAEGFNACFDGYHVTKEWMKELYQSNVLGYCYHALAFDGDKIGGFNTWTPYRYYYDNSEIIVGLSGSSYVLKEYRKDIMVFADMANAIREEAKKDGVVVSVGVSNKNSYKYGKVFCGAKDVMSLPYWILPIRIGKVVHKSIINPFSFLFSLFSIGFNYVGSALFNSKVKQSACRIKADLFFLHKRLQNEKYYKKEDSSFFYSYTVSDEDGIKCAYIMCAYEKGVTSYRALTKCVSRIFFHEKVDMIMFIGTLRMKQLLLLKVPSKYEPKLLPLTYAYTDEENKEKYPLLQSGDNWDFTLINLDVR